jgi:cytochrome c-type protein NapB
MTSPPEGPSGQALPSAVEIGFAVVLGFAVVGFFVGTGSPPTDGTPLVAAPAVEASAGAQGTVPTYRQERTRAAGPGMDWDAELAALRGPGRTDPVDLAGSSKTVDLADRSENRAYDGAPPTIPHPVRQASVAECLACHAEGMRLRGAVASPVSHAEYASCTQCHVVSEGPMPGARLPPDGAFSGNTFVGLASPTAGPRAWDIAPPQIPHKTFMREQCMSCHGPNGRDAMRSTHPDRQQCEQCHAPSAVMDQRVVPEEQP